MVKQPHKKFSGRHEKTKDENPLTVDIARFFGCSAPVKSLIFIEKCGIIMIERKKEIKKILHQNVKDFPLQNHYYIGG